MLFGRRKKTPSRQESLAARPLPLVAAELEAMEDGGARLKVTLRGRGFSRWFLRLPEGSVKTFELDPMGRFVWETCDGKTSVQQVIRRLARRYAISLREAEVSTLKFLQVLTKKGLLGLAMPQERKTESNSKRHG